MTTIVTSITLFEPVYSTGRTKLGTHVYMKRQGDVLTHGRQSLGHGGTIFH